MPSLFIDFASTARQLVDKKQTFDMVLVDLGVSSPAIGQREVLVFGRRHR